MNKRLLGANLIRLIYSDNSVDVINKFGIDTVFKYTTECEFIDNINYSNTVDLNEGKKQVIRVEIERDSNFAGCLEDTTVYNFNNYNGIYTF